jgi:DNA-binding MarR family transcriptional regulator
MATTNSSSLRAASELRRLVALLRRRLREVQVGTEIPDGALSVLMRLEKDGPATTASLAADERVRPQSMRTKVLALEADGLISRRPDETDGRRVFLELTELGHRRVQGDREARREWLTSALEDRYSSQERDQLLAAFALLERLFEEEH